MCRILEQISYAVLPVAVKQMQTSEKIYHGLVLLKCWLDRSVPLAASFNMRMYDNTAVIISLLLSTVCIWGKFSKVVSMLVICVDFVRDVSCLGRSLWHSLYTTFTVCDINMFLLWCEMYCVNAKATIDSDLCTEMCYRKEQMNPCITWLPVVFHASHHISFKKCLTRGQFPG